MKTTQALPEGDVSPIRSLSQLAELICEAGDLPVSSEAVTTLLNLKPEDTFSAEDLAALILRDYGLTQRILCLANSCYYNPTGQEVTTVSRAIVLLGIKALREIAVAATFFETFINKVSPKIKHYLLRSLAGSYLGAFLARDLGTPLKVDPEEIFIYVLFHRIGRILLAIYSPKTLFYWEEMEKERPGLVKKRLYQLMEKLTSCWSLPSRLLDTLEGAPQTKRSGSLASWISQLDFGVHQWLISGDIEPLENLFSRMNISSEELSQALSRSLEIIKEFWPAMTAVLRKPEDRDKDLPPKEIGTKPNARDENFYREALREITAALASESCQHQEILLMIMETTFRAFACEAVFLAIPRPPYHDLVIKYGVGTQALAFKGSSLPYEDFLDAIFGKGILWSSRIENLFPHHPLRRNFLGRDLLLVPLSFKGKEVGLILALRASPFTNQEKEKIDILRHLGILAIKQGGTYTRGR